MLYVLLIALLPLVGWLGYWTGRSDGYVAGYNHGKAAATLEEGGTVTLDSPESEHA